MNYEDFKGELYRIIMQQGDVKGRKVMLLEKGFTTRDDQMLNMIRYINRTCFGKEDTIVHADYIHVVWGEGKVRSMMNWSVRDYYYRFKKEGWEGILPELLIKIQNAGSSMDWLHVEEGGYEMCQERLIIRAINYENNKYELEDCIYKRIGEIALTLYAVVSDEEEDYVTMKIPHELVKEWGVPEPDLFERALDNTCRLMPPRLYYCTDLKRKHRIEEGIFMKEELSRMQQLKEAPTDERDDNTVLGFRMHEDDQTEGSLGYRLSTTKGINGAVAFFYPGVQKQLAEMIGGNYLAAFTSIHEAIIHPERYQSAANIRDSIKDINQVFPKEEMLSNEVYHYYARSGVLVME